MCSRAGVLLLLRALLHRFHVRTLALLEDVDLLLEHAPLLVAAILLILVLLLDVRQLLVDLLLRVFQFRLLVFDLLDERFFQLLFALLEIVPELVAFHVERVADRHLLAVDVVGQAEFGETIPTEELVVLRVRRFDQIEHVLLDQTVTQLLEIAVILILNWKDEEMGG